MRIDSMAVTRDDWREHHPAQIISQPEQKAFIDLLAQGFLRLLVDVQTDKEECVVALGGGRTPVAINRRIVALASDFAVDWDRVYVFFSDERCVPPDHADSNYRMIRETLLLPLTINDNNVFRIQGELPAPEAARLCHLETEEFFRNRQSSCMDLALLGLGSDGHTASLFPDRDAAAQGNDSFVAGGRGPEGFERITMRYQTLNRSRNIWFMIRGQDKQQAFEKLLHGPYDPQSCPAQGVYPINGKLVYFVGVGISIT